MDITKYILALQHLMAMFGATVLVPILTGLNPSVALVSAGIGTLIFHYCTSYKVPVFLGSSFAFIPVIITVKEIYKNDLTYAQGGIVIAGFLYVLFAFFIVKFGTERTKSFFPAHVTGPMIVVIGLKLVPVALGMYSQNYILATTTFTVAILINFFARGFLRQLSIIIAVFTGYVLALSMNLVDTSMITNAAFFSLPPFSFPKFDMGAIIIIAPVVIAVFMEHIGDITTNGAVVGADFIKDPGLDKTLMGDGLATMAAGFIGGPANTTYAENTGLLAMTKNYNPAILRITAIFAILLGLVSKFGYIMQSIPAPVMGGISLILFSMISIIGVKTIKNSDSKMNMQNIIVMATILIIGLGSEFIEKKLGFCPGIVVNENIKITGLSFAAFLGVALNKAFSSFTTATVTNS
ncbi:MAG: uracil-xanthine permease [Candidatus Riflebacteria bacterium]|nr:uracil-xanthine permease [Candidatus Riflebacteria bacterium]